MQKNHRRIVNNNKLVITDISKKVIPIIPQAEKEMLDLMAKIFVKSIINEKSNRIHQDFG